MSGSHGSVGPKGAQLASLKIRAYSGGNPEPDKTFAIPLSVLNVAAQLMPSVAADALKKEGIDLDEIVEISRRSDVQGILLEAEDHIKNEKVVLSIE